MGVVKFLSGKGNSALPANLQKDLPKKVESVEPSLKKIPDTKNSKPAVTEAGRTDLKKDDTSSNAPPPTSSSKKPLGLAATSADQTSRDIKAEFQKIAASAGKLRKNIKSQSDRGKGKADVFAPSGTPEVRKRSSSKSLAVKTTSVRLPIVPLEVTPIQSLDPFEDERSRVEFERARSEFEKNLLGSSPEMTPSLPNLQPKVEAVQKKAAAEWRRMQELEKRTANELSIARQQERSSVKKREGERI